MEALSQLVQIIKKYPNYEQYLELYCIESYNAFRDSNTLLTTILFPNHELSFTYDTALNVCYCNYCCEHSDNDVRNYMINDFISFYSTTVNYNYDNKTCIYKKDLSTEEALFQLSTVQDVTITVQDFNILEKFFTDVRRISKELYDAV